MPWKRMTPNRPSHTRPSARTRPSEAPRRQQRDMSGASPSPPPPERILAIYVNKNLQKPTRNKQEKGKICSKVASCQLWSSLCYSLNCFCIQAGIRQMLIGSVILSVKLLYKKAKSTMIPPLVATLMAQSEWHSCSISQIMALLELGSPT